MKIIFTTKSLFQYSENIFISDSNSQPAEKFSFIFKNWHDLEDLDKKQLKFNYILFKKNKEQEFCGKLCYATRIYYDHRLNTINIKFSTIRELTEDEIKNHIDYFGIQKDLKNQHFYIDKAKENIFKYNNKKPIKKLQAFISEILKEDSVDDDCTTFYRGHANHEFQLLPSIYRSSENNINLIKSEHLIFRESQIFHPDEFNNDRATIDKLVRMQHFSLPTRLLDLTTNPLISLFFACNEFNHPSNYKTGQVLKIKVKNNLIKYFDSDSISCVANLSRLDYFSKNNISFGEGNFNEQDAIAKLIHFIKDEKPYFLSKILPDDLRSVFFLKSKHSNERIVSQSGCFAIFGMDAKIERIKDIDIDCLYIEDKINILNELDKLNINSRTIFPSIENTSIYLKNKYLNHY